MINQHSGQGSPRYGDDAGDQMMWVLEMPFFVQRGFCQLILSGVFERFPQLRFILTESGCAWAPGLLRRMDGVHMGMKAGMMGEVDMSRSQPLKETPTFYARRNCWYGASFPSPADVKGRDYVGVDRILWGNDYPHYEGCYPYSRENMRLAYADVDEKEVRMMLGENAANLYGFDLEALRRPRRRSASRPSLVRVAARRDPGRLDVPDVPARALRARARKQVDVVGQRAASRSRAKSHQVGAPPSPSPRRRPSPRPRAAPRAARARARASRARARAPSPGGAPSVAAAFTMMNVPMSATLNAPHRNSRPASSLSSAS